MTKRRLVASLGIALFGLIACAWHPAEERWTIALTGDTGGSLGPCGCTEPMSGGIRRTATAMRSLGVNRLILDVGGNVLGTGTQAVYKAETYAQAVKSIGVDAWAVTSEEAKLGMPQLRALANLSGNRLTTASLAISPTNTLPRWRTAGPFLIAAVSPRAEQFAKPLRETPVEFSQAIQDASLEAQTKGKRLVLVVDGDQAVAQQALTNAPEAALVAYRFNGHPPTALVPIGTTPAATPGERGKTLVRFDLTGNTTSDYRVIDLGPDVADDAETSRYFKEYLGRVEKAGLLEKEGRAPSAAFAGAKACAACHAAEYGVWKKSKHAHALSTLVSVGQNKDPECVGCHVTGLNREHGFVSPTATPQLAFVGCESCHGPGLAHTRDPLRYRFKKTTEANCITCHRPLNSPNFRFFKYWKQIFHGHGGKPVDDSKRL